MTDTYVTYLDPDQDQNEQLRAIREWLDTHGGVSVEVHHGGRRGAEVSATDMGVSLIEVVDGEVRVDAGPTQVSKPVQARRKRAGARYEALAPKLREAALLGLESHTSIARYFNEIDLPLPSGKKGKWQAVQVQRLINWTKQQEA